MDDLISRQKVLDVIDAYKYLDGNDAIYRLKQWLNKQESVQPKMGRWIYIDDSKSECSICGHREFNERFLFEDINFCAKCGAKMVETQESEE